jgi:ABC-type multidrug transport system fused ATPase/permease subunit
VRTWMNMDRMNKALTTVVEYDNQLLKLYRFDDSVLKATGHSMRDTLILQGPSDEAKIPVSDGESGKDYLRAGLVAGGMLIIILLVLLIMRSVSMNTLRRTLDESEETYNNKIKHMEFLESEVKKMKSREKEIKAELERGIVDNQEKVQQLRLRIGELSEENARLVHSLSEKPVGNNADETGSSGETVVIKQGLIDNLEALLATLKNMKG